ncbi:dermonecrotic toxin domain-containing protein [Pseudomonas sp. Pseu.R1]|uniref:dermonecrotic toxin domain-containing protein n=1 Tax=Pseudomonas sp. Pseu.R1 TaxID=3379818 RepID=UPI003B937E43
MNTVTGGPSASDTDRITQHLAALAEACAGCSKTLARTLALRDMATAQLSARVRQQTQLIVSNPDAIFFNWQDERGVLLSRSMTDLLIDLLRRATPVRDLSHAQAFLRHNTLDPSQKLTAEEGQSLVEIIRDVARDLPERIRLHFDEFWRGPGALQPLLQQHFDALTNEIALRGFSGELSETEQSRLLAVVDNSIPASVFSVHLNISDDVAILVPSAYVVGQFAEATNAPEGVVFLLIPGAGIERFASLDALRDALTRRVVDPADVVANLLRLSDQHSMSAHENLDPQMWTFKPVSEPVVLDHVRALQHRQMEDLHFVLEGESPVLDAGSFLECLERLRRCAHLDDAMGQRFRSLANHMSERAQPHWRKYASPEDREHLNVLEGEHRRRKERVQIALQGLESIEAFAAAEMMRYCREHLGCEIDPGAIQLTLSDTIHVGGGDALQANYSGSLLHFAVKGLPLVAGEMSVSPERVHVDWSHDFVTTMLDVLKLPQRYAEQLRDRYLDEENLRVMAHHRDSAIELSAQAARMQGHLVQDRSHELLMFIRADKAKEGASYSIGSLHLKHGNTRFRDLIVFSEETEFDEQFVLYAPGAPNGQDFYEFSSWRQLSLHVGGWLASESGRSFVHDQLASPAQQSINTLLNNIQLKPSLWGPDSCVFERCPNETYEANLALLVLLKVVALVKGEKIALWQMDAETLRSTLSGLATVESRIEALNTEFARLSPGLMNLRDYVHQQTSARLQEFLRSQGYRRPVDPDTLYLGLGQPYFDSPDFGEHSPLQSLTDLMMHGAEDILSYRPGIHLYSSTGLDVSQLPKTLIPFLDKQIREADLGARYMSHLTNDFLKRNNPIYVRRKALIATRSEYEMTRGVMLQYLEGDLHDRQYSWLRAAIHAFGRRTPSVGIVKNTGVSAFKIAGQIIEGVFIFRDFSTSDPDYNMLYTPNAPDGVHFRPLTDYGALLNSAPMQSYFYGRVAYAGQRRVGTFIENFERGGKHDPAFLTIVNRMEDRISSSEQLYGEMFERMIADVDERIETSAEKHLSLAWNVIRWTGTILLLPFPGASFGWTALTSTVNLIKAYEAYSSGDRATALPLLIFGVMGMVSGADGVRAFIHGSQTVLKGIGLSTGLWAWRKLELSRVYQVAA